MDRPTLIHIGMPKTGTTSLQSNLFVRHPQIQYIGKPLLAFSPDFKRLTRGITYDVTLRDPESLTRFEEDVVAPLLAQGTGPVVISEEEFSTSTPTSQVSPDEIADTLAALFPSANILVTMRSQGRAFESLFRYMQSRQMLGEVDFQDWFEALFAIPQYQALYDYGAVADRYRARFGSQRVHLVPFEWMRDAPEGFVRHVARLMDADEDVAVQVWGEGDVHNKGTGATVQLTADQEQRIAQRYSESNHRVAQSIGLDLKEWGYAV